MSDESELGELLDEEMSIDAANDLCRWADERFDGFRNGEVMIALARFIAAMSLAGEKTGLSSERYLEGLSLIASEFARAAKGAQHDNQSG